MAEVIGVVSSVITIAETAGNLGTCAIKLKRLWDEVQYVPYMIKQHMEQLEMLAPTLDDMNGEFQQTRSIVENDEAAKMSLGYCRRAFEALEMLIGDMEKQIVSARKGKRTIAKFKVTLKGNVIQDYERRLQYALQLVMISQQTYSFALSRVRHSILMSEIQALQLSPRVYDVEDEIDAKQTAEDKLSEGKSCTRNQSTSQSSQRRNPGTKFDRLSWQRSGLVPKCSYQATETSDGHSYTLTSKVYQARFQLPSWMTRKAWDFQAQKAYDGWKIQLTSWCTRNWDDEIFAYAREGRTDELLAAFQANEASLYDCTPDGFTLLDQALYTPQIDLFKLLLNMGLKIKDSYKQWDLYWEYLSYRTKCGISHTEILSFTRFLAHEGRFNDEVEALFSDDGSDGGGYSLERTIWSIPGLLEIIRETNLPSFDQIASVSGFKIRRWDLTDPGVLLDILTHDDLVSPASFRAQLPEVDPAYSFAYMYIVRTHYGESNWMESTRILTKWVLDGATPEEVVQMAGGSCTPLQLALFQLGSYWGNPNDPVRRDLGAVVRAWLQDLREARVNLEAYGRLEASALSKGVEDAIVFLGRRRAWGWPYFVSLEYGPRPEDWKLDFDPCVETYAGEFWAALADEKKLLPGPVPGAWLDEGD